MIPSPYTDTWLATELAARLRDRLAYDAGAGHWLRYDHPVWREDTDERRVAWTLDIVYELRDAAGGASPALAKAVERWQRAGAIQRVLEHARHQLIAPASMPANPWTLAEPGGNVIELRADGSIHTRPATPADWQIRVIGARYQPGADYPRWRQFLVDISADRPEWIALVQRLVGYSLSPSTEEQRFVFAVGGGANGKSTFLAVLRALFGEYACDTAFQTFVSRRDRASHDDALMALEGARLVTAQEGAVNDALDDATIKRITGETVITGSRKFERTKSFRPEFMLWLAANSLPRVDDLTIAFWRRQIALPFDVSFTGRENPQLERELLAELPGILNWALEGYARWRREGLGPLPACVIETATRWRQQSNPLADWLDDCCIIDPRGSETLGALYSSYQTYCQINAIAPAYRSQRAFWRALEQLGYDVYRSQSIRKVRGIRLK
jgi:putative DNA primase/helicase